MILSRASFKQTKFTSSQIQIAKTPLATFESNVSGLYIPEILAYIQATQAGSGDPSPINPRAISGVSAVDTTMTGKNLANSGDVGDVVYNDQQKIRQGLDLSISGTYTVSIQNAYASGTSIFVKKRNADGTLGNVNYLLQGTVVNAPITLTIENGGALLIYTPDNKATTQSIFDYTKLQIELGSTATSYKPYTGTTATTALGGTYYGGYVNVTTGLLTVTSLLTTYDKNSTWTRNKSGVFYVNAPSGISDLYSCNMFEVFLPKGLSSELADSQCRLNSTAQYINFKVTSCDTVEEFKALLGDNTIQMVYTLATPIEIQLTPAQLEQLLGQNNVFCSTGDVAVKYWKID